MMTRDDYQKRNSDLLYKTIAGIGHDFAGAINARAQRKAMEEEQAFKEALKREEAIEKDQLARFDEAKELARNVIHQYDKYISRTNQEAALTNKEKSWWSKTLGALGPVVGIKTDSLDLTSVGDVLEKIAVLEPKLAALEQIQRKEDKLAYVREGYLPLDDPLATDSDQTHDFLTSRQMGRRGLSEEDYYGEEPLIKKREQKARQNPFQSMSSGPPIYPNEPQEQAATPQLETSKLLTSAVQQFSPDLTVNIEPPKQRVNPKQTDAPKIAETGNLLYDLPERHFDEKLVHPVQNPSQEISHKDKMFGLWNVAFPERSEAVFDRLYAADPEGLERTLVLKATATPIGSPKLRNMQSNAYADGADSTPRDEEEREYQERADQATLDQITAPLIHPYAIAASTLGTAALATPFVAGQTALDVNRGEEVSKALAKNAATGYGIPLGLRSIGKAIGNYRLRRLAKDTPGIGSRQQAAETAKQGYPLDAAHQGDRSSRIIANDNSKVNKKILENARQNTTRNQQKFLDKFSRKYEKAHQIKPTDDASEIKKVEVKRKRMAEKEIETQVEEISQPIMEKSNALFDKAYQDIARGDNLRLRLAEKDWKKIGKVVERNQDHLSDKYFKIGNKKLPKDVRDLWPWEGESDFLKNRNRLPNSQEVVDLLKNLDGHILKGKGKLRSQEMANLVGFRNELINALPGEGVESLKAAKKFFREEALGVYKAKELIRNAKKTGEDLDIEQMFFKPYNDKFGNGINPQKILFDQLTKKGDSVLDPVFYLKNQQGLATDAKVIDRFKNLDPKLIPDYMIMGNNKQVNKIVNELTAIHNEVETAHNTSRILNTQKGSEGKILQGLKAIPRALIKNPNTWLRYKQTNSPEFLNAYIRGGRYTPRTRGGRYGVAYRKGEEISQPYWEYQENEQRKKAANRKKRKPAPVKYL